MKRIRIGNDIRVQTTLHELKDFDATMIKQLRCYFIPNIELPENKPIGKYGLLRETFLKKQRNYLYNTMLMNGTLNEHLYEIDQTAKQQVADLVNKMAKAQGVDEALKASNQLSWVGKMENIRHSAEETVLNDYVYA